MTLAINHKADSLLLRLYRILARFFAQQARKAPEDPSAIRLDVAVDTMCMALNNIERIAARDAVSAEREKVNNQEILSNIAWITEALESIKHEVGQNRDDHKDLILSIANDIETRFKAIAASDTIPDALRQGLQSVRDEVWRLNQQFETNLERFMADHSPPPARQIINGSETKKISI